MSSFGKKGAHDHFGFVHSAVMAPAHFILRNFAQEDAECSKVVFTKINVLNFGEPLGQKKKDNCL